MSPVRSPLRIALVVVLAIGAVVAGGYVLLADETPRPSEAEVENASERVASLDGFAATIETTIRMDNETIETVRNVVARPGTGKYRSEAVDAASGYDLTVSNGTVAWLYDTENETVQRLDVGGGSGTGGAVPSGQYVEQMLRAAFDDGNDTATDVSALPMVSSRPAAASGTLPANESALDLNVTYAGTERTNGREAYVLELTPSGDSERLTNYSARAWIDTDRFVILRQQTSFEADGERFVTTSTYRNVSFDPDLSDVSFRFDPPSDANVTTVSGPSITQYDSRAALAGNASLPVPDPDVPADFRFDGGSRTVGEQRSITLQYTNGTSSLTLAVSNGTSLADSDSGTAVDVDGETGRLQTLGASRMLGWECRGNSFTVVGSATSNETVVDVARSVGCE